MGLAELVLVAIVAVLVIKPKQLPRIIKQINQLMCSGRDLFGRISTSLQLPMSEKMQQQDLTKTLSQNQKRAALADKEYANEKLVRRDDEKKLD